VFTGQADGNDTDAVYALAGEAIIRARGGKGPAFLEFKTYRWYEHCGPLEDQHLGYRPPVNSKPGRRGFPSKFTGSPARTRHCQRFRYDLMTKTIDAEIDEAVTFAKASPSRPAIS